MSDTPDDDDIEEVLGYMKCEWDCPCGETNLEDHDASGEIVECPTCQSKFGFAVMDSVALLMPNGAKIMTVQTQDYRPHLWAMVDPLADNEARNFNIIGTGHVIHDDPGEYIGTFQLYSGGLVFHMFEQR